MMITREQYAEFMKEYVDYERQIDKINEALRPFDSSCFVSCEAEDLFVRAVEAALDDTNHWTSYFLYDREGDLSRECVTEANGKTVIDTSDWGKVYDLITGGTNAE